MKVSVLEVTTQFCGDHDREVSVAHDVLPDETVLHLCERILGHDDGFPVKRVYAVRDYLQLRIIVEH